MNIHPVKVGVDNCYIIRHEKAIIVDGGMPGEFDEFCKGLHKTGIKPADIQAIVITHCHWDHIGCAQRIKDMTGAKLLVHKQEQDIMEKGMISMPPGVTLWGRLLGFFLKIWSSRFIIEPTEADIFIEDDEYPLEEFGIRGKVVFTPGHSPGSISVVLDSGEAFVGDMAMSGLPLTLRPALPIFAEDMSMLKRSWRKLFNMGVKQVYPAHGQPFCAEKIEDKITL